MFSGLGRVAAGVLYGVITFVVLLIVGVIVVKYFDAGIGGIIEKFSALIGFLVGVYVFFTGARPTV